MRLSLAVVMLLLNAFLAGKAAAQSTPPEMPAVQADVETIYKFANGREVRNSGHFYRSQSGQVREDSPLGAVITDVAAGTITILVAETKEARMITIPVEQRIRPGRSAGPGPDVFEETVVGGRRVVKSRARSPRGQNVELWTASDLGVVLWTRTEAEGLTSTRELRNISTQEPSPSLFEIPPDYVVIQQEARLGNGPQSGVPPRVPPGGRGSASPPRR